MWGSLVCEYNFLFRENVKNAKRIDVSRHFTCSRNRKEPKFRFQSFRNVNTSAITFPVISPNKEQANFREYEISWIYFYIFLRNF
jgi:hypothetical protein